MGEESQGFRVCQNQIFLTTSLHTPHNIVNSSSGGNTAKLAKSYFASLTQEEAQKLYDLYKWDFEAFGYDPGGTFSFICKIFFQLPIVQTLPEPYLSLARAKHQEPVF